MGNNLVKHANREFDIIGYPTLTRAEQRGAIDNIDGKEVKWEKMIRKAVMELMDTFSSQGHSGTSAAQVISLFNQLAQFKPLAPLTNNPAEWLHIEEDRAGQPNLWQNRRQGEAFSHDGGKTFYLLSQRTWFGKHIASRLSGKLRMRVWSKKNWIYKIHTALVFEAKTHEEG